MEDMPWLSPSDAALRGLALRLADAIDTYGADPETLALLVPKYHAVLKELGGTPTARKELHVEPPEDDLVAELRVVR
ncbi:MAG: hypothetical protein ACJ72N_27345 [Labedaea sp.]